MFKERAKSRLIEFIKYDLQWAKRPVVWLSQLRAWQLSVSNQHSRAFDIISTTFRTGWPGSFSPAVNAARRIFKDAQNESIKELIIKENINATTALERTKKFFDDPENLFEGVIIILKSCSHEEKGVLLIKYSYYFPLFAKLFHWEAIADKYHIVLEPSWAGYCEKNILMYTALPGKVYVMTYEDRDAHFINTINTNLKTVDVGPSWWVDHRQFKPSATKNRDIDILMIAAWADFKRHYQFFRAISELKKEGCEYKVVLAGYPGDKCMDDIKSMAKHFGVFEQTTFYEWIPPEHVSELMQRAKVNVLWSRFEGNNRSIIEGMFCGTPCILREGHNYGQHYDYINPKTGILSSESALPKNLKYMVENYQRFSPRDYVLNHRSCEVATKKLNDEIKANVISDGGVWNEGIVKKVNELHGMRYFNPEERQKFQGDYNFLASMIRKQYKSGRQPAPSSIN